MNRPVLRRYYSVVVGRDSSVGIDTRYGLYGPGIESHWRARFSAPAQIGPGAHRASHTMGYRVFPGGWEVKRPVRGVYHPPFLAPRLKKGYRYTSIPPLDLRVACSRTNFIFTCNFCYSIVTLHSNYIPLLEICFVGQISNPFAYLLKSGKFLK